MSEQTLAPLVLTGAPRSGTTLLYNLFDGHPDINWLITEGYFFEYLYDVLDLGEELFVDAARRDLDEFIFGLRDRDVMPPLNKKRVQSRATGSAVESTFDIPWSEEAFRRAMQSLAFENVRELWVGLAEACLAGIGIASRRRFACLKAADYAKSAYASVSCIDDARAIVVVRDPLRAIDSLKQSRSMRGEKLLTWPTFAQTVADYSRMVNRIDDCDPNRAIVIRYEDLVTQPVGTMMQIAEWLEIPFIDAMCEPTFLGETWPGFSSFDATNGIDKAAASREIKSLDGPEIELIQKHLAPFMGRFGYA